jgi:hypothetical protein
LLLSAAYLQYGRQRTISPLEGSSRVDTPVAISGTPLVEDPARKAAVVNAFKVLHEIY